MSQGFIITYIGDGKGKTSAAIGLAVRAAGAGYRVLFTQFVKSKAATEGGEWPASSEIAAMKKIDKITTKIMGRGFVGILGDRKNRQTHRLAAQKGLAVLKSAINSGNYDIVVADELISALELGLVTQRDIIRIVKASKEKLIAFAMTGHNKYNILMKISDLVTEMKMIKHPYYQGLLAQRGIDF